MKKSVVSLGELCEVQNGFAFDSRFFSQEEKGLPLIRIRDIMRGFSTTYYSGEYDDAYIVNNGDFLIGMDGDFNIGEWHGGEALLNQRVCRLLPTDKILPKFIYYFIPKALQEINAHTSFATVKHLSSKQVRQIAIPLLSISEQQRIVSLLDAEFAKIDTLKANAERNLQNAKDLFQAALKKELEPKEGWKAYTIADLFEITDFVSNGSFASLRENVKYYDEPNYAVLVRLVDYSNNFDKNKFVYIDKHGYDFLSKSKLFGGELIMCNIGATIGKTFICPNLNMPMSIGPNVLLIRTKNNCFYNYYLQTTSFKEQLRGIITKTTLEKFNKTQFKQLTITIPTNNEQQSIVARLDVLSEKCNTLQANYEKTIALCDDLKQALLRKAFNGEI